MSSTYHGAAEKYDEVADEVIDEAGFLLRCMVCSWPPWRTWRCVTLTSAFEGKTDMR